MESRFDLKKVDLGPQKNKQIVPFRVNIYIPISSEERDDVEEFLNKYSPTDIHTSDRCVNLYFNVFELGSRKLLNIIEQINNGKHLQSNP